MSLTANHIQKIVDRALSEDISFGDITTDILVPNTLQGKAVVVAKSEGILAGVKIALAVFRRVDSELHVKALLSDGTEIQVKEKLYRENNVILEVEGKICSILKAERTALNFLQHMSGVATTTNTYVKAVEDYPTRILDTRKTIPGLRLLEKYAVAVGGGQNHRNGLSDGILIKDNHIHALRSAGIQLEKTINLAKANAPHTLKIEVEVENLKEVEEALNSKADILLLDNMTHKEISDAVFLAKGKALTEASGGITVDTVRAVAATGVDFISVGALTHSAKALDVSLELL